MAFQIGILFLLAVIVTAAGLAVVYFSKKEKSGWLCACAWILIVSGVLTAACSAYHAVRYQFSGCFEGGSSCSMMEGKGMGMGGTQTMQGMMRTMGGMQDMMDGMMKSKGTMDPKEMKDMMQSMQGMQGMMKDMMGSKEMKGMESKDDDSDSGDSTDHASHRH